MRFLYNFGKSIAERLFSLARDNKPEAKTIAEERDELADKYKGMQKTAGIGAMEGIIVSKPAGSVDINKDDIVKKAALKLKEYVERRLGSGGFEIHEQEFEKTATKKIGQTEEVILGAKIAFQVDMTTPKGDIKRAYALVDFKAGEPDEYTVNEQFLNDKLDKSIPATFEGLTAYVNEGTKREANKVALAFYNIASEVPRYETLNVTDVDAAVADLRAAGFQVIPSYLDGIGRAWEIVALPEQYPAMHKVLARYWDKGLQKQYAEPDWPDRSLQKKEEAPGYYGRAQQLKKEWVERASEKNPVAGADDALIASEEEKLWQDRTLEKIKSVEPEAMLKYEEKIPSVSEVLRDNKKKLDHLPKAAQRMWAKTYRAALRHAIGNSRLKGRAKEYAARTAWAAVKKKYGEKTTKAQLDIVPDVSALGGAPISPKLEVPMLPEVEAPTPGKAPAPPKPGAGRELPKSAEPLKPKPELPKLEKELEPKPKKKISEEEAEERLMKILEKHDLEGKEEVVDEALDEIIRFFDEYEVEPSEEEEKEEKGREEKERGEEKRGPGRPPKEEKEEERAEEKLEKEPGKRGPGRPPKEEKEKGEELEEKEPEKRGPGRPPKSPGMLKELAEKTAAQKHVEGDPAPGKGDMKDFGWPRGWDRPPEISGEVDDMSGMKEGKCVYPSKDTDGFNWPRGWDRPPKMESKADEMSGMKGHAEGDLKLPEQESTKVRASLGSERAAAKEDTTLNIETKQEAMTGMGKGSEGECKLPKQESMKVRAKSTVEELREALTPADKKVPAFAYRSATAKEAEAALASLKKQKDDVLLAWNQGLYDDYKTESLLKSINARIAQISEWRKGLDWHERTLEKPASEAKTRASYREAEFPDRSLEKNKGPAPYAEKEWADRSLEKRTKEPNKEKMMLLEAAKKTYPPKEWVDHTFFALRKGSNKDESDEQLMEKVKQMWLEFPVEDKLFILQKYGAAEAPSIWKKAVTARMIEQFPYMSVAQIEAAVNNLWHNDLDNAKREEILLRVAELEKAGRYSCYEGEEHPAYESHPKQNPDPGAPKAKEETINEEGREKYDLTGKAKEEETPGSADVKKYQKDEWKGEEYPGKPSNKPAGIEAKASITARGVSPSASTVKDYPRDEGLEDTPGSKDATKYLHPGYEGEEHKKAAEGREKYDVSEKTKVAGTAVKAAAEGEAKADTYKPSRGSQMDALQHEPVDPKAGKYDGDAQRRPNWMSEHLDELMEHMRGRYEYSKNIPFEAPEWSKYTTLPTQKKASIEEDKKKITDKAASVKQAVWGSPQNQLPFEDMRANTERHHKLVRHVGLHDNETRDVVAPDETGSVSHMPGTAGAPVGAKYQAVLDPNWYAEEIFAGLRRRSFLTAQEGFEATLCHEQARGLSEEQKVRIAEILRQWGFNVRYRGLDKPVASEPFETE